MSTVSYTCADLVYRAAHFTPLISTLGGHDGEETLGQGGSRALSAGSTHLVLVDAGLVGLQIGHADGRAFILEIAGEGEMAIAANSSAADLVALLDSRFTVVDVERLLADPDCSRSARDLALEAVANRLRQRVEESGVRKQRDSMARLAHLLVVLGDRFGDSHDERTWVPRLLFQRQMAMALGVSRETVNKALRMMERRGWVEATSDGVLTLDRSALKMVASGCCERNEESARSMCTRLGRTHS